MIYTIFAKKPGGELMRFNAAAQPDHESAIALVKPEVEGATVLVDVSLTTPDTEPVQLELELA